MKQAMTRVDLKLLKEFLRFPADCKIVGVRPDPDNAGKVLLEIEGNWLPDGDESVAEYKYLKFDPNFYTLHAEEGD